MNDLFYTIEATADGAFIVDDQYRIQSWNRAAEKILGYNTSNVIGQRCYQFFQGSNQEIPQTCMENCQISKLIGKGKPVPSYDVSARTSQGEIRWLNMSIITIKLKGSKGNFILHLFRDISKKKKEEQFFHRFLEQIQKYPNITIDKNNEIKANPLSRELTKRQKEVLNLLVHGSSTKEIAETLSISWNTVRNHIQNILQTLQVHSRLEAVAYALENNLLDE